VKLQVLRGASIRVCAGERIAIVARPAPVRRRVLQLLGGSTCDTGHGRHRRLRQ